MKNIIIAIALTLGAIAGAIAFDLPERAAHACQPNDPGCNG